jgi:hypothetical protein
MEKFDVDLLYNFHENSTRKDGETAFEALEEYLSGIEEGALSKFSIYQYKSNPKIIRLLRLLPDAQSTGPIVVGSTPSPPGPHGGGKHVTVFDLVTSVYEKPHKIDSLHELKNAFIHVASGKQLSSGSGV